MSLLPKRLSDGAGIESCPREEIKCRGIMSLLVESMVGKIPKLRHFLYSTKILVMNDKTQFCTKCDNPTRPMEFSTQWIWKCAGCGNRWTKDKEDKEIKLTK